MELVKIKKEPGAIGVAGAEEDLGLAVAGSEGDLDISCKQAELKEALKKEIRDLKRTNSTTYDKKRINKESSVKDFKLQLENEKEREEGEDKERKSRMIKTSSVKKFLRDGGALFEKGSLQQRRKSQTIERQSASIKKKESEPSDPSTASPSPNTQHPTQLPQEALNEGELSKSEDGREGKVNGNILSESEESEAHTD
eukprot:TRINITY_DN1403_c0_g1_i2.p1 TRINITY_DN1403_c0_g1~~TRINITY_DN1403_c0_g1_i2.p1  ORF type:complete len:198 (+),score=83.84 TRINITY_DN1403_c0_g1_i2:313-906(+)